MSHAHDMHEEAIIEDLVDDPVIAHADPIGMRFTRQDHTAGWTWVLRQQVDRHLDTPLLPTRQGGERLGGPACNLDAVPLHPRPSSAFTSSQGR